MNGRRKILLALSLPCTFTLGLAAAPEADEGSTTILVSDLAIARDFDTYSKLADAIVIGKVGRSSEPYMRMDEAMVQRDVRFEVSDVLKGDFAWDEITVVVEGGTLDRQTIVVEEAARLNSGEECLLFLGTNTQGEFVVFAGPQGKYLINGSRVVGADNFGASLSELENRILDALDRND